MPATIAYREQVTLAGNDLRHEWRVQPLEAFQRHELVDAWGSDWQKYRPHTTHVQEERYIRNGVDEGWKPTHSLYDPDDVLENIDEKAVIVDSRLARIAAKRYSDRDAAYAASKAKEEEARNAKREEARLALAAKRSHDAFEKLLASPKDKIWAERWNAFIIRARDDERVRARIARDPALYNDAMYAETVPTKRKAIKAFLESFGY